MRILIMFVLLIIMLNLTGQNDTVIYYSALGRSINSDSNALFHEKIVKKTRKKYLSTISIKQGGKWELLYESKIKKDTDSSLIIICKSLIDPKTNRVFYKTEGGYLIKDYVGQILSQEGFSKLLLPVIKDGNWHAYDHSTGLLKTEELFSDNQLITNKYWINNREYIADVFYMTDKTAEFKDGDTALLNYISEHVRYPKYAYNNNITGTVIIRFVVMKDGTVEGVETLKKVNRFLDQEALRVIRSLPETWSPGEIENKKVNMLIAVPVIFQINKTIISGN